MRNSCLAILSIFLLVDVTRAALFNDGMVNTVSSDIPDGIEILDGGVPIGPTTVNLVSGTVSPFPVSPIPPSPPVSVFATQRSRFNMSGGITEGAVVLMEDAAGNMTGGMIETDLVLFDNTFLQLDDGTIDLAIFTFDESRLNVTGGEIGFMNTTFPSLEALGESEVNISGGEFADDVLALEQAIVTMTGGNVMDDLEAEGMAQVFLRGGEVGDDLHTYDDAVATVTGGIVNEDVEAEDNSMIFIRGGILGVDSTLDTGLGAYDDAMITVFGTNFVVDGNAVGSGEITDLMGTLTGTLANGDVLDITFEQDNAGQIKLVTVPEPSSVLLWGLMGCAGMFEIRRRRKARG